MTDELAYFKNRCEERNRTCDELAECVERLRSELAQARAALRGVQMFAVRDRWDEWKQRHHAAIDAAKDGKK